MASTTALTLRPAEGWRSLTLGWWIAAIAPLAAAAVAFVLILDAQLLRLFSVSAPSWDLGFHQQLLWSLANGHGWSSSFEYGHNFIGIHLEPILLPIAAIELAWPSPVVPLVFAAAGLAATAPAAFLMFRAMLPDRPAARWLALAIAFPMPFWAAMQQAGAEQFHPEHLALPFGMLAVWAGLRARPWLLWTLAILVISCKEDQTYTAFVIGLLIWRVGPDAMRPHGRRIMVLSVAWLVILGGLLEELVRGGTGRLALHYAIVVMFPLIVAAGFGARRLLAMDVKRIRLPAASLLAAAVPALVIGLVFGEVPPAFGADQWLYTRTPAVDRLLAATRVIPPNAPVYADNGAAVWLANRQSIQVLGSDLPPDRYIVVDRQDWAHRLQASAARADIIAKLEASGRRLLVDDGRFQVWSPPG
jgi:hypothetical protein